MSCFCLLIHLTRSTFHLVFSNPFPVPSIFAFEPELVCLSILFFYLRLTHLEQIVPSDLPETHSSFKTSLKTFFALTTALIFLKGSDCLHIIVFIFHIYLYSYFMCVWVVCNCAYMILYVYLELLLQKPFTNTVIVITTTNSAATTMNSVLVMGIHSTSSLCLFKGLCSIQLHHNPITAVCLCTAAAVPSVRPSSFGQPVLLPR